MKKVLHMAIATAFLTKIAVAQNTNIIPKKSCTAANAVNILHQINNALKELSCWDTNAHLASCFKIGAGSAIAGAPTALQIVEYRDAFPSKPNRPVLFYDQLQNESASVEAPKGQPKESLIKWLRDSERGLFTEAIKGSLIDLSDVKLKIRMLATNYDWYVEQYKFPRTKMVATMIGEVAPDVAAAGLKTSFYAATRVAAPLAVISGINDFFPSKGDSACSVGRNSYRTMARDTSGKCVSTGEFSWREQDFLRLKPEEKVKLLEENPDLCSHFEKLSTNLESSTQQMAELIKSNVEVSDITCTSPSGGGGISYNMRSTQGEFNVKNEILLNEDKSIQSISIPQKNLKMEFARSENGSQLSKLSWKEPDLAWRGSRSIFANQISATKDWEGDKVKNAIYFTHLNKYWGSAILSCCSSKQTESCLDSIQNRKKTKKKLYDTKLSKPAIR